VHQIIDARCQTNQQDIWLAPVTRLLFLARLAVVCNFDCDVVTITKKRGGGQVVSAAKTLKTLAAAIDQLKVAVNRKKKQQEDQQMAHFNFNVARV
jgi:hypothetical protein